MHGKLTTVAPHENLHPALRYLFDGLLEVDAEARRFRDPEDVLHAFRVIRGRLGDGEADTIDVMSAVPIPMDEEAMEPTALAVVEAAPEPVDLTDVGMAIPASVSPGDDDDAVDNDDFSEATEVSTFDDRTSQNVAVDDLKTINTGARIDEPRRPPPPPAIDTRARTMTNPVVLVEDVDIDFDAD